MASLSRHRRAFWGDVRFLVGIALVALSITGVWFIVSTSDDATPVLQAQRTITQGEALRSSDFQVVELGLGALTDEYLAPQDLRTGQVASRTVREGEIVPVSVPADAEKSRSTTVLVESSIGIPQDVLAGATVEVWHAPPLDDGRTFDTPRILVADVIVRRVIEAEGMLADAGTQVELVIDRADVADVLAAITGGSSLSVVPVGPGS
ncbi:SAF domain-containing protein [Microbacterium sp. PMB16]|uniref:SAF domain-containing protein n=1 Tax=Microbacterium sp. PMB16 TaxID=3120157 RepID=UPI003F4B7C70